MKKLSLKKNIATRVAAGALACTMVFGGLIFTSSGTDYKGDISDTKEDLNNAKDKLSEIEKKIQERQDYLRRLTADINDLESERISQMSERDIQIAELKALKEDIENFDAELERMEQEHAELENLLLDRSRIMYQSSTDFELIQLFFRSKNIFDFIEKLDIQRKMIAEDKALMEQLKDSERAIEEKREQQQTLFANKEVLLAELEGAISDLENNREIVEGQYATLSDLITTLEGQANDYQEQVAELTDKLNELERKQREAEEAARRAEEERKRKEEEARRAAEEERKRKEEEARRAAEEAERARRAAEEAQKAKEEAARQAAQNRDPLDAGFIWPIETYYCFTGYFGYRTHPITKQWALHSGIDLAASTGTKIYATQSGTVSLADWNGSYGLCVIIDHGNGLQSLYGHCSKLLVSKGQTVTQGQTIALVGATGGATGSHLHFEVRLYGTPVDPLPYLKGKY
ncbi:MAG: peptidoglycan DD-metalloendopeptidase family protein [Clostridia bacterium]|nr:peptidoglycan DD-metalloendopeptidase family protein [Clostridia bacterium]